MVDTLSRIVRRVSAGTGGTSAPYADDEALTSLAAHLQTSDTNHFLRENALRTLWTGGGWRGFYKRATPTSLTTAPTPGQIELTPPVYGSAWGCLGDHLIHRLPDGTWPVLKLTFLWRSAAATTTGGVLYTGRGEGRWWDAGDPYDSATTTSTTFVRKTLSLQITEAMLAPVRTAIRTGTGTALREYLRGHALTAWVGFYNSSNNSPTASDVVAPVLYLAAP
jgi:hypothetical protein